MQQGRRCAAPPRRVCARAAGTLVISAASRRAQHPHPPRRAAPVAQNPAAGADAAAAQAAAAAAKAAAAAADAAAAAAAAAEKVAKHMEGVNKRLDSLEASAARLEGSAARLESSSGSIFEVAVRGLPRDARSRALMRSLPELLQAVQLPASEEAVGGMHALLAQVRGCCLLRGWPGARAPSPAPHAVPPCCIAPPPQDAALCALRTQLLGTFGAAKAFKVCSAGSAQLALWALWAGPAVHGLHW